MKSILEQQGFTPYEADVYLCLLENGSLSAYEVSEKTGLYRQAAYDALNRMVEKGIATLLKEGKRRVFKAADPKFLLEQVKAREQTLSNIIPQLLLLKQDSHNPVEVEVFKGESVIKLSLIDVVSTLKKFGGESTCTAVDEQPFYELDQVATENYIREMTEHDLHERVILRKGVQGTAPAKMSTYRHVDKKYFNANPTLVYGNTVQILLYGNPLHMILIRNQAIADAFRKQFELMWSVAEPCKNI